MRRTPLAAGLCLFTIVRSITQEHTYTVYGPYNCGVSKVRDPQGISIREKPHVPVSCDDTFSAILINHYTVDKSGLYKLDFFARH